MIIWEMRNSVRVALILPWVGSESSAALYLLHSSWVRVLRPISLLVLDEAVEIRLAC